MSTKPSRDPPNFAQLLDEVAPTNTSFIDVANDQGVAFRTLYDGWVELGGYSRGKPRRSVRQIKIWLGAEREVRSLETKLAGKTLLQRRDLENLFWLFLSRWRYNVSKNRDESYPIDNTNSVAVSLASEIYINNGNGRSAGLQLPIRGRTAANKASPLVTRQAPVWDDGSELSRDAILERYSRSDALITVSPERTFIGGDPGSMLAGFHRLMDDLRDVDQDGRFRTLIWIVDLGRRESDLRSQAALYNVDFLASQFRSFLATYHDDQNERANWFLGRTIVLLGTMRVSEIDFMYKEAGLNLPDASSKKDWLTADRLLFGGVPPSWLTEMARRGEKAVEQRTITVHRDLALYDARASGDDDSHDLEYLFHFPKDEEDGSTSARCVKLASLGRRWNTAFRTAHEVSLWRLGKEVDWTLDRDPREALNLLRNHRFAAFTALEFCHVLNKLAFRNPS